MEQAAYTNWEIKEGTGILTLDRPPENYLTDPVFVPSETLAAWISDPLLKGILITGSGRHFSAGADLKALFRMVSESTDPVMHMSEGRAVFLQLSALHLPLVAAIRGTCFGGGLEIALGCDIRICSDNALFAFPETNQGLMPGLGGTVRLPRVTGIAHAMEMILGGDMLSAQEALDIGIVDRVVPKDELLPAAMTLLKKMTQDRPLPVIRSIVRALRNSLELPEEEALREETKLFCRLAVDEAHRRITEGL